MTITAPNFDYDDGLVHSHGWASSTPPGIDHLEARLQTSPAFRDGAEPDGDSV